MQKLVENTNFCANDNAVSPEDFSAQDVLALQQLIQKSFTRLFAKTTKAQNQRFRVPHPLQTAHAHNQNSRHSQDGKNFSPSKQTGFSLDTIQFPIQQENGCIVNDVENKNAISGTITDLQAYAAKKIHLAALMDIQRVESENPTDWSQLFEQFANELACYAETWKYDKTDYRCFIPHTDTAFYVLNNLLDFLSLWMHTNPDDNADGEIIQEDWETFIQAIKKPDFVTRAVIKNRTSKTALEEDTADDQNLTRGEYAKIKLQHNIVEQEVEALCEAIQKAPQTGTPLLRRVFLYQLFNASQLPHVAEDAHPLEKLVWTIANFAEKGEKCTKQQLFKAFHDFQMASSNPAFELENRPPSS